MGPRNTNVYIDIAGTGLTVIETVRGDHFLIDTDCRHIAQRHTWSRLHYGEHGYARAGAPHKRGEKQKTILLHRVIADAPDGINVDHVNGVTSDCRSVNLRSATKSQNACNQKRGARNTSGVKGVVIKDGRYIAKIHLDGQHYQVGSFGSLIEAEFALKQKRLELHGKYARHE